jgi:hypothetical protein
MTAVRPIQNPELTSLAQEQGPGADETRAARRAPRPALLARSEALFEWGDTRAERRPRCLRGDCRACDAWPPRRPDSRRRARRSPDDHGYRQKHCNHHRNAPERSRPRRSQRWLRPPGSPVAGPHPAQEEHCPQHRLQNPPAHLAPRRRRQHCPASASPRRSIRKRCRRCRHPSREARPLPRQERGFQRRLCSHLGRPRQRESEVDRQRRRSARLRTSLHRTARCSCTSRRPRATPRSRSPRSIAAPSARGVRRRRRCERPGGPGSD